MWWNKPKFILIKLKNGRFMAGVWSTRMGEYTFGRSYSANTEKIYTIFISILDPKYDGAATVKEAIELLKKYIKYNDMSEYTVLATANDIDELLKYEE